MEPLGLKCCDPLAWILWRWGTFPESLTTRWGSCWQGGRGAAGG